MEQVKSVVVVGGGTAGWITAAKLAKELGANDPQGVQVTLLESSDIPTIGVGEGTWPTMRKTLASLGIDEQDFIKATDASFKQGTRFINWHHEQEKGSNYYYHLFSSVVDSASFNLSPYWLLGERETNYAQSVSAQDILCDRGLAPKLITNAPYEGVQNYAYHLDAGKFATFLKAHCVNTLGVRHLVGNVIDVQLDVDGNIGSLFTDQHGELKAGLYVDCTGFSCLLLGKTLGVQYKSIRDQLFVDSAIAIQMPYENAQDPIASATHSTAQEAGWIWDIGLQSRRGTGHVYCSEFMSADEAEKVLRDYLGPRSKELSAKHIQMNCGYREKFWHKNCVAIGLSAAFVEPLEASAIFLIEAAVNMLSELFPHHRSLMETSAEHYNRSFELRWQKTIDFIKLHYVLSQRKTPFWLSNKAPESIPESVKHMLEVWRHRPISKYDFDNIFEPFPQDSYQYVLYGMGFEPKLQNAAASYVDRAMAQKFIAQAEALRRQFGDNLPNNRELLEKVHKYGFQKC
ncbi:tryptophan halogenase family protein [Pseudoalteromonas rubra]|uniref:Tryptophan 7-halogenase n=1 Tax=Pseudoalteromonas rubra TaxID=43658 RepID=A0A5S3WR54_9GAMM|nr:tryptophan halogenase family protein [Pseudoalteromonas rubra]TMP31307.1 tryptophan 7-halogenase [Pseudoalteromonas rubra]